MMKKIIQKFLKVLAKLIVKKYKPLIIGITGSVGKTSTKEAIFSVLKNRFSVRKSEKNYNNEIGLPLTIIGAESAGKSLFGWLKILWQAKKLILFPLKNYPQILILEMAADRPGDLEYLVSFAPPRISVVTAVAPVHLEFFKSLENIAQEKSVLVKCLPSSGQAILNADDERVYQMKDKTDAKVLTYGFSSRADIMAFDWENDFGVLESKELIGVRFKINYKGKIIPVFLPYVLGKQQTYAALAAIGVGLSLKMNLIEIVESLKEYNPPPGRMRLIAGVKRTLIIDDSYNASPLAVIMALDVLKKIPSKGRKFVVLGDMLELGSYSTKAHFEVGEKVASLDPDYLVAVGENAKNIIEGARKQGMPLEKIFHFFQSDDAAKFLKNIIQSGDVILVKGSQRMRMEKIVKELMAYPEKARELLVRQGKGWR